MGERELAQASDSAVDAGPPRHAAGDATGDPTPMPLAGRAGVGSPTLGMAEPAMGVVGPEWSTFEVLAREQVPGLAAAFQADLDAERARRAMQPICPHCCHRVASVACLDCGWVVACPRP